MILINRDLVSLVEFIYIFDIDNINIFIVLSWRRTRSIYVKYLNT